MRDTYLDDDRYKILVKGLAAATRGDEPYAGYHENMIQIALGEAGGVWPTSIKEDAARARLLRANSEGCFESAARNHARAI